MCWTAGGFGVVFITLAGAALEAKEEDTEVSPVLDASAANGLVKRDLGNDAGVFTRDGAQVAALSIEVSWLRCGVAVLGVVDHVIEGVVAVLESVIDIDEWHGISPGKETANGFMKNVSGKVVDGLETLPGTKSASFPSASASTSTSTSEVSSPDDAGNSSSIEVCSKSTHNCSSKGTSLLRLSKRSTSTLTWPWWKTVGSRSPPSMYPYCDC